MKTVVNNIISMMRPSFPLRVGRIHLILLFLIMCSFEGYAQYAAMVCPDQMSIEVTPEIEAPESWFSCSSGTDVEAVIVSGQELLSSDPVVERLGGGPHKVKLTVNWLPGAIGKVEVEVYYHWWHPDPNNPFDCDPLRAKLYTYTFRKGPGDPGGHLAAETTEYVVRDNEPVNVSLKYTQAYSDVTPYPVTEVRYWIDGNYADLVSYSGLNDLLDGISFSNTISGVGRHTITAEVKTLCPNTNWSTWYDVPPITVDLIPSCISSTSDQLTLAGGTPILDQDGIYAYDVRKGLPYTIQHNNITDFDYHYQLTHNGGSDITMNGKNVTVNSDMGSYRVEAVYKPDPQGFRQQYCPQVKALKLFNGGHDLIIENLCPVILPRDLPDFNLPFFDPDDIVLQHFAAVVRSKSYIEVQPGMSLVDGAELIAELPDPEPQNDITKNYVEEKTYDEYGRILGAGRTYFDDQGRPVQQQSKHLTKNVIMASQTLYDAQGRAAIATLSAPADIRAGDPEDYDCPEMMGEGLYFTYKPDFVRSAVNNQPYNYANFDLEKENNPDPISNLSPGTLGWYHSANNGDVPASSAFSVMNEPLVATTQFPYSRTIFHDDGSGQVKGATRPGDVFRAGAGHMATTDTEPVTASDTYLQKYFTMRADPAGLNLTSPSSTDWPGNFLRTVTIDEHGKKTIIYTDNSGNTIISLYFDAGGTTPVTKSYQFYDDAGRLVAMVSPNGVQQYEVSPGTAFAHIDKTSYVYNYKGWLLSVTETDAGTTDYAYRRDGLIRFSQNEEQADGGRYSYTNYDRAGRPIESGEFHVTDNAFAFASVRNNGTVLESTEADGGLPENAGTKSDQVFTFYDEQDSELPIPRKQRFVQGAVSCTKNVNVTTWYSYDEQGRTEWMAQRINGMGMTKVLDYRYGRTGAIQEVTYQRGVAGDHFTHYYEYDYDGRLFKVYTSTTELEYKKNGELVNPSALTLQATYYYYLHGPLKRIEYASQMQGIDYVYTADGMLKAINDGVQGNDPGGDGLAGDHSGFRKDAFGLTLDYYSGDYLSNAHTITSPAYPTGTEDQFNGIIKGTYWHDPVDGNESFAYGYQYDERYQFRNALWGSRVAGSWVFNNTLNPYMESIIGYDAGGNPLNGYDLNGNIQYLNRHGREGNSVANFRYNYKVNTDAGNTYQAPTNMLESITLGNTTDVFRQYQYNKIGQMTEQHDVAADKTMKVEYDVTGKVRSIRNEDDVLVTSFEYDDRGFRLKKITYDEDGEESLHTWYVRDASGNIVATYEQDFSVPDHVIKPVEVPVYASGRIGLYKPQYGITFYELSDHLGNVRAVIGEELTQEYLATMETERIAREEGEDDFKNIKRGPAASYINHTPSQVTVNGETETIADANEVVRINNRPMGIADPDPIGAGIFLWVHPGDEISAEVYALYANFTSPNDPLPGIAGYLAETFGPASYSVDGANIFSGLDQSPAGVFSALTNVRSSDPRAFLSYVLYDRNMGPVDFDQDQVTTAAKISPTNPTAASHQRLSLSVTVEKEGYIYIYVSNQSDQNMDVYFDDLKITHTYSDIVSGGDFYPFGLAIEDRQISRERYRFGYQGKFAEKDDETGWNHFELREYDPEVGRFLIPDPARQYHSPYVSMGNNPINMVDPTGGTACPDGNCGDVDVMMAHDIVAKHFDPSQNQKDISSQLLTEIANRYEPGTVEYSAFGSLVGEMWSQVAYLDKVNPSLSEFYLQQIGGTETIGDRIDLIYAFVGEVSGRQKTFDMMGLMLTAYSASFGAAASGAGPRATPTSFQYIKQIPHWYSRVLDRGVNMAMIDDALANPLHRGAVLMDKYGRASQQIIGRQATVVINPNTGNRITVWRTGTSTLKKYGGN